MTGWASARAQYPVTSLMLGKLGPVVVPAHRTPGGMQKIDHQRGVFDPQWIAGLPLPTDHLPESQTVALINGADFHRETDPDAVTAAYLSQPRTRVYESIHVRSDGWHGPVALHLTDLLRHRVVCTLYESRPDDTSLGAHMDDWWSVIVQARGVKRWRLWPDKDGDPQVITTRAGDVLLLPKRVLHEVSTPGGDGYPGYSAHLVYAVIDNEPIDSSPPPQHHEAPAATGHRVA